MLIESAHVKPFSNSLHSFSALAFKPSRSVICVRSSTSSSTQIPNSSFKNLESVPIPLSDLKTATVPLRILKDSFCASVKLSFCSLLTSALVPAILSWLNFSGCTVVGVV